MESHQSHARTVAARIVKLETDVAETVRVTLEVDDPAFTFLAGQWLNLGVELEGELKVGGYSFASAPSELPRFELGIKDSERNPVSRYFHRQAELGDVVKVDGGHGPCVYEPNEEGNVVLVAGGIGLTPMLSIARTFVASKNPGALRFMYSASEERGFAFRDLVLGLQDDARVEVEFYETGGSGQERLDVETILDNSQSGTVFYLCGPSAMVDQLSAGLVLEGVPEEKIRFEKWW